MVYIKQNAAILWTGGKDSSMALYEASQNGYRVRCLVTFAPPEPDFLAHPLGFIKMQAQALALPHYVLPISAPFERSYETSLCRLRDELGIHCVVTGDIAEVDGNQNWIRARCDSVGMSVHAPLWGRDRNALLRQLLDRGFKVRFSCVKTRWLDESWIGRELNDSAIAELRVIREQTGLDLCGEEGEYHTLVIDGPQFTRGIDIRSYSKRAADSLAYMQIHELELIEREDD
jgi:diphthine-ammonia ligase